MRFLYSFSIYCFILGIQIAKIFYQKAKQSIEGRKQWRKRITEALKNNTSPVIWFHVSSLGEFEQARPLIIQIKQKFPQYKILLTFFSPSGYEARKNFEYADGVFYIPYDTPVNARDFLNIVQPQFIFFVKYEFWVNFLLEIIQYKKRQKNVRCFLISSIFRKHQPFFKWYGSIFIRALDAFDWILVQDELSIKLLKKIGIHHVKLSGDTRIDRVIEVAHTAVDFPIIQNFINNCSVIIAGSTWYKDEQILIPALNQIIKKNHISLKCIIVPHHPDEKNVQKIIQLLDKYQLSYAQYTHLSAQNKDIKHVDVLVIDTIGILNKIYRYGHIAYVGGGFTTGIHNILEPAVYGLPVVIGPKYQKFYEAVELIKTKGAYCIHDQKEMMNTLSMLLLDRKLYQSSQVAVKKFIFTHQGAVEKTMQFILPYLSQWNND